MFVVFMQVYVELKVKGHLTLNSILTLGVILIWKETNSQQDVYKHYTYFN